MHLTSYWSSRRLGKSVVFNSVEPRLNGYLGATLLEGQMYFPARFLLAQSWLTVVFWSSNGQKAMVWQSSFLISVFPPLLFRQFSVPMLIIKFSFLQTWIILLTQELPFLSLMILFWNYTRSSASKMIYNIRAHYWWIFNLMSHYLESSTDRPRAFHSICYQEIPLPTHRL